MKIEAKTREIMEEKYLSEQEELKCDELINSLRECNNKIDYFLWYLKYKLLENENKKSRKYGSFTEICNLLYKEYDFSLALNTCHEKAWAYEERRILTEEMGIESSRILKMSVITLLELRKEADIVLKKEILETALLDFSLNNKVTRKDLINARNQVYQKLNKIEIPKALDCLGVNFCSNNLGRITDPKRLGGRANVEADFLVIHNGNNSQAVTSDEYPLGISDLFKHQFPAGLPFGLEKPNFAIVSDKGSQKLHFEPKSGMGILSQGVYPNFTFQALEASFKVNEQTNDSLKKALIGMNQTESEKNFFLAYTRTFNMASANIPVLIPQAWIQWHSLPKTNLRSGNSVHADDLYRVDFVAFWNNKRYAILIDDIGHYSKKNSHSWLADEESYSKRLKEDRKLRKEKWHVFRVSNWEIRHSELIPEILNDLREFIGF